MSFLYRTVSFQPAPVTGWRVCWVTDDGRLDMEPVAGWLVQERYGHYADGVEHVMERPAEGCAPAMP